MTSASTLSPRLLLDTHIWIWLIEGSSELGHKSAGLLDQAGQEGRLFVSAIAVWELATLVAKKRLTLSAPIKDWVQEAMSKPGMSFISLTPEISIESTLLPGSLHADPADRIIIATARIEKLTLVTRDENIHKYSRQGHLKVIKN